MSSDRPFKFKLGWIPDEPDVRDHLFGLPPQKLDDLPSSVDLRGKMPPIWSQGDIGSCTAFASCAAFQYGVSHQNLTPFDPSQLFVYYNTRELTNSSWVDKDTGAPIRNAIKSLGTYGVCNQSLWPYDDTMADQKTDLWPKGAKPAQKPSQEAYEDAAKHKAVEYYRIEHDLDLLKGCLAEGYPFVFGFFIYKTFWDSVDTGVIPMPKKGEKHDNHEADPRSPPGHAVVAVGYDDAKKTFILQNSWGAKVGDKGYFYMPYDYLTSFDPFYKWNYAEDFWTIRTVG